MKLVDLTAFEGPYTEALVPFAGYVSVYVMRGEIPFEEGSAAKLRPADPPAEMWNTKLSAVL